MAVLLQFAAKAKNGAIIHQGEMEICLVGCDSKNETFAVKLHECCSCRLYAMLVGRAPGNNQENSKYQTCYTDQCRRNIGDSFLESQDSKDRGANHPYTCPDGWVCCNIDYRLDWLWEKCCRVCQYGLSLFCTFSIAYFLYWSKYKKYCTQNIYISNDWLHLKVKLFSVPK